MLTEVRYHAPHVQVGHAGTLDPLASGLLLVCVGKATKFSDDFMATDKRYSGTVRLGQATASYDAESEVVEEAAWEHITGGAWGQGPGQGLGYRPILGLWPGPGACGVGPWAWAWAIVWAKVGTELINGGGHAMHLQWMEQLTHTHGFRARRGTT